MTINKKLIKYNFTPNVNVPTYIVVHDTGNRQTGANAEMHYQYFNGGDRQASAHVFIDSTQILQMVEFKDSAWHCGDGGNAYGINNRNSIGLEICINPDGDYNKAVSSTIELVVYLMKAYNIPFEKVVRHYDASRKNCPQTMNNNGDWSKWVDFKNRVKTLYTAQTTTTTATTSTTTATNSSVVVSTAIEPWEVTTTNYLKDNFAFLARQKLTFGIFAYLMNNYIHKFETINPIEYLKTNKFMQNDHAVDGVITWNLLGYLFMNRLNETVIKDPLQFLMTKGFITSAKNGADFVKISSFGAVMSNYISRGGKL